jgi:hypothetical protein
MTGRYAKSFSQGTWNTLVNSYSAAGKDRARQKQSTSGRKKKAQSAGSHFYKPKMSIAVPFVEGADLHVIRRTNELTLNEAGSEDFSYAQFLCIPLIPPIWLLPILFWVILAMLIARFSWGKKILLKRKFPDGGPSREQRATSYFDMYVTGTGKKLFFYPHQFRYKWKSENPATSCSISL